MTAALMMIGALALTTGVAACAPEQGGAEGTSAEVALTQDPSADESAPDQEEPQAQEAPPIRQPRTDVQATIDTYLKADPGLSKFFDNAAGYVVFPGIGKAGLGIGGAHGNGEVIAKGRGAIGKASMTVVVFTRTKSGMMAEASVGGQDFSYEAY
ncbi:MAG: hypothetical protein P8Y26_14790 [Gemmatimonadales bacterium]